MEINFTNVNFEKDINLPENIQTLNNDIKKICNELPALNIVKDFSLLDYTIEQTEKFKRNKKNFVVFGTGGSNLGARALINTLIDQLINKSINCLLYTSPSPRDGLLSRMPSSA